MKSRRKLGFLCITISIIVIVVSFFVYIYTLPTIESRVVEISKKNTIVKNFLNSNSNTSYHITKAYLASNGTEYTVTERWDVIDYWGTSGKPTPDGENHFVWRVVWYCLSGEIVAVFIDRDSLQILFVDHLLTW